MKEIKKNCLCLIPARGGSKAVPDKNIIDINGRPMISYSISSALESGIFDRVIVSTDSKEIEYHAKKYNAEVPFIRPSELATDESLVQDTIVHALKHVERHDKVYDYVCLMQATTPLVISEDILKSYEILMNNNCDLVASVCEPFCNVNWVGTLGEDGNMDDFFRDNICGTNRQKSKNMHLLNGSIYFGKWSVFYNRENYYKNARAYIMPQERSIDVDSYFELGLVRNILETGDTVK